MKLKQSSAMKIVSGVCLVFFLALTCILGWSFSAMAAEEKPIKIGVVTFLSGGAAGPFGVPARNGAEVIDGSP